MRAINIQRDQGLAHRTEKDPKRPMIQFAVKEDLDVW